MIHEAQKRQPSEFTFYQSSLTHNHKENTALRSQCPVEDEFMFSFGLLAQQFKALQNELREESPSGVRLDQKTSSRIEKEQIQRVLKYFRKYQPQYFNKIEIKQLSYKFRKGVNIKKYKQGYYFGETQQKIQHSQTKRKVKHGKGILVYGLFDKNQQKKRVFQGQWKNDKKDGLGFQRLVDGSVYHGFYKQNKPEGRGKFTNGQGQTYQGQWTGGVKEGKGFWKGSRGETYVGEWNQGKLEGYGVFVNEKGDRYQGQFKDSMKHGQGIEKFMNGDIYKGFYQNDRPGGFGEYYWKNKSYFKGHFQNGLRSGKGLWKRGAGNCDKYEGQYQTDKKWGYGVFTWANGNLYQGNYTGDLRNGYGEMHWVDGSSYKGNWKDGVQHGKGQLFIVAQGLRIGLFQNNQILQIQYEQPAVQDLENQENQTIYDQGSKLQLMRNKSKLSSISVKLKNYKTSGVWRHKAITQQKKRGNFFNDKSSDKSFYENSTINQRKKLYSQSQSGMRSVPLKNIIQHMDSSSRYLSQSIKQQAGFRISKKVQCNIRENQSLDQSRMQGKRKNNRILHSSFYLHRYKSIGKPVHQKIQSYKFSNTANLNPLITNSFRVNY